MPRKRWSTVQMPDGWLQVIRSPRPQSARWPVRERKSSKPPLKGRRGSQVTPQIEASRRGQLPEEVVSIARARVMKLEAAMAAVGEADPTFFLSFARGFERKRKPSVRCAPVERIASSKDFIERAKKRILVYQAEVSQTQEALTKVQSKLQQRKSKVWSTERLDWQHFFRSLQKQGRERRKFLQHCRRISPTSLPNSEHVSPSYGGRFQICSCSCRPVGVAKNEKGNSP